MEKKILGRSDILGIQDVKIETVSVPEWGGHVCIRSMAGSERDQFDFAVHAEKERCKKAKVDFRVENMRSKLLALTLCDEQGKRLFGEEDVVELGKKNAAVIDRLADVAKKLNNMVDKEEALEEARKN